MKLQWSGRRKAGISGPIFAVDSGAPARHDCQCQPAESSPNFMPTNAEEINEPKERMEDIQSMLRGGNPPDALDWAVFGCLAAGVGGIYKAMSMDNAWSVLLCLLGSIAAFGVVIYAHLRKG